MKTLQDNKFSVIFVDPCGEPEAAAEAAYLVSFSYDELKADENRKTEVTLFCYSTHHEHESQLVTKLFFLMFERTTLDYTKYCAFEKGLFTATL